MITTLPHPPKIFVIKALLAFLLVVNLKASAQYQPVPIGYRTGFYNNYYKNPDSALFYARKLTAKPQYMSFLRQALHDDLFFYFSDEFHQKAREQAQKTKNTNWKQQYAADMRPLYLTIGKMATDPNKQLAESVRPLYLWVSIQRIQQNLREAPKRKPAGLKIDEAAIGLQQTRADDAATTKLVNDLITGPLAQKDLFQNKTAIYALLAYRDIEKNKSLQGLSKHLLTAIINSTQAAIPKVDVNTASDEELKKRALSRYYYATANYIMANKLAEAGNLKDACVYYKAAAEYSPDLIDLNRAYEYSNEEFIFAKKDKELYRAAYRDYQKKNGNDKLQLLATMTEAALRDPTVNKTALSNFYAEHFAGGENFAQYWRNAINNRYTQAPALNIKKIDGTVYSSTTSTGKWTLIDFWGSWCGPCREEHPALQKLYSETVTNPAVKLGIVTVACHDTLKNVKAYMAEFKYNYPVAMDDGMVTRQFSIPGYPTKILITPEGKYLCIPFNIDWVAFIKRYMGD